MLARSLAALAIVLMMAPSAFATTDPMDEDFGHVQVQILPTVDVLFLSGAMDVTEIMALDQVCATLYFQVHSNGQVIQLRGGASALFKEDVPGGQFNIPVDQATPVVIKVDDVLYDQEEQGLPILMTAVDFGGNFGLTDVYHCDWLQFGSPDGGSWSYDVILTICWLGDDAELFQGMYSAGVILWAQYVNI
jgi:hypothetical protein